ncbi:helix-turn-helix transcriptional regulator [Cellulomonas soli]|uniref:Protein PafB n=1 Tax=Cellulomonas soli TaxID=931535 RepID=A0A512PAF8_9CELL|nr:WYL domain-containing protein [Cellulomonas soli]NYI60641.1 proteasome accessory factor B [Cellulomonas soli]GEP68156.1 protein PafB [Cellulomonas soli]
MAAQIPPAERLLNLVIALVNTAGRMTKEQVRASVSGYGDAPSDDAFERMFERDKDTLRDLGVPILTVTGAHGDDIGYRIDQDAYALPPLELTPAELGVLALAAQFWQDQALRTDTSRALTKLRAAGEGPESTDLVAGLAPRVRAAGGALSPLVDAVQARQAVRFTYRAASTGQVRDRTVEPWQLLTRRGGWVLVGFDRDRAASRSFRLSRIEGKVRVVGEPGQVVPPTREALEAVLASWASGEERVATLAVLPERAGATRARSVAAPDGSPDPGQDPALGGLLAHRDVLHVPYRSTWELAEELVGYGDAVVVLDPPALRETVLRLLRVASTFDRDARSGPAGSGPTGSGPTGAGQVVGRG